MQRIDNRSAVLDTGQLVGEVVLRELRIDVDVDEEGVARRHDRGEDDTARPRALEVGDVGRSTKPEP